MKRILCLLAALLASGCGVAVDTIAVRREADVRAPNSPALLAALQHSDPVIRGEAAAAMGRTQSKLYAPALRRALRDPHPDVRLEAAFALGQLWIDEPNPAPVEVLDDLTPAMADGVSRVRAAAVEALSKLGAPDVEPQLARLLADWAPGVRHEAASGLFRLRFLKRIPAYSPETVKALTAAFRDGDAETRWRAVHAFTHWPAPSAAEALSKAAKDDVPLVRLFALRALAQLGEKAPEAPAKAGVEDLDDQVRAEAMALLRASKRGRLVPERVVRDPSIHVRAAAADALGTGGDLKVLRELADDRSPLVRGQAIVALAVRQGDAGAAEVAHHLEEPHWAARAKACEAAGQLPKRGGELLERCLRDRDVRVRAAGLEAMGKRRGAEVDTILSEALAAPDSPIEIRGTAVAAVVRRKTPELAPALVKAYDLSKGLEWVEVRESIVEAAEALAEVSKDPALAALRQRMLDDPAYSVRVAAARSLKTSTAKASRPSPSEFLGKPLPLEQTVSLETEKGVVLIELYSEVAPDHSASFVDLVRRGFFNGTAFHRIVSNFVVQGGDPRGSGWGGPGYALRDEISPMKFMRGTVGMAKAGKDTGGSQLFVTVVPAPHLDGRFTAFGRVVAGMDVVDKLAPGDAIVKASVR